MSGRTRQHPSEIGRPLAVRPQRSHPATPLARVPPDIVFREAERGDGSPGVLFRFLLQISRRVREKTKEDRSAQCDIDVRFILPS